jgi:hypothetical protein
MRQPVLLKTPTKTQQCSLSHEALQLDHCCLVSAGFALLLVCLLQQH